MDCRGFIETRCEFLCGYEVDMKKIYDERIQCYLILAI